jgi:hypothetical protein
MAIIFFSVAGTSRPTKNYAETFILFLLSILTIIVNGIALSAILFRISEWGFSLTGVPCWRKYIDVDQFNFSGNKTFKALRRKNDKTDVGTSNRIVFFLFTLYGLSLLLFSFR